MVDMPLIDKCFGMVPPKHGCWLIALFGLGLGGLGIASIIIFSAVEEYLVAHLSQSNGKMDASLKKLILVFSGLTSLMLLVANAMLLFGVFASSLGLVKAAKCTIFAMCMLVIILMVGMPGLCFYQEKFCTVKKFSTPGIVIGYSFLGIFNTLWLYFMVVAYNYELEL